MSESIGELEANVHALFSRALALAKSAKSRRFDEVERGLWSTLLELGRALVSIFLVQQVARLRLRAYVHQGISYELDEGRPRTTEVGTRFGKVSFTRPVGRRRGWRSRGVVDLPVDREVGLCGAFSLDTMTTLAHLCTLLAFNTARKVFARFCEWMPSPRGTLRIVDAVGEHARAFLESVPSPDDDGEILVIQVDGRGAPMIGTREHARRTQPHSSAVGTRRHAGRARRRANPRERRRSGERSKNVKVANLAVLYTLRRTDAGLEGPINKRIIGTFDGLPKLFAWLVAEATKRGYGKKRTIFLADGDPNIWRHQAALLPNADVCIDWYHVAEKLWEVGESIFGTASNSSNAALRRAWVGRQTRRLRQGRSDLIAAELRKLRGEIAKSGPAIGQSGSAFVWSPTISSRTAIAWTIICCAQTTSTSAPVPPKVQCATSSGYASTDPECAGVGTARSGSSTCAAFTQAACGLISPATSSAGRFDCCRRRSQLDPTTPRPTSRSSAAITSGGGVNRLARRCTPLDDPT